MKNYVRVMKAKVSRRKAFQGQKSSNRLALSNKKYKEL